MDRVWQALHQAQSRLEQASIPSVVIGGLAVVLWGLPRVTQDVDLKVLLERSEAGILEELVAPEGVDDQTASFFRKSGILFFAESNGVRVDYMLADTSFDRTLIERRIQVVEHGEKIWVCTPEDLLVLKLISTRPRDYEDAVGVASRQKGKLDRDYIVDWLRQFEMALDDSTLVDTFSNLVR